MGIQQQKENLKEARTPLVSVIIPTKNVSGTIGDCLESIKNQTYNNIEIIIVDDFSTDKTKSISKKYTEKFFEKKEERSFSRNFGVSKSNAEFVLIIDSDMNLSPKVVSSCVEKMINDKSIKGLVIPEESFGKGFWANCKKLERSFYVGVEWMEGARFFRKEDYERVGGFDISMVSGEDWDLSQRISKLGRLDRVDEYIFHN